MPHIPQKFRTIEKNPSFGASAPLASRSTSPALLDFYDDIPLPDEQSGPTPRVEHRAAHPQVTQSGIRPRLSIHGYYVDPEEVIRRLTG